MGSSPRPDCSNWGKIASQLELRPKYGWLLHQHKYAADCEEQQHGFKFQQHACSKVESIPVQIPMYPFPIRIDQNQTQTKLSRPVPRVVWKELYTTVQTETNCRIYAHAVQAIALPCKAFGWPSCQRKQRCSTWSFSRFQHTWCYMAHRRARNLLKLQVLTVLKPLLVEEHTEVNVMEWTHIMYCFLWRSQSFQFSFEKPTEIACTVVTRTSSSTFTSECCIETRGQPSSPSEWCMNICSFFRLAPAWHVCSIFPGIGSDVKLEHFGIDN